MRNTSTANGKPSGRFELPQLTPVNYSLTEGTDIPPPPESPVQEQAPPPAANADSTEQTSTTPNGNLTSIATSAANGIYEGRGRAPSADQQPPLSPASTTRAGSIRRFLSRRSLNSNYTNGTNHNKSTDDLSAIERPGSSMDKPKRSSSWFRRFGSSSNGNAGHRTSVVYEQEEKKPEKKGPPPPKLPELGSLKAGGFKDGEEGSLGGEDMFKNIK